MLLPITSTVYAQEIKQTGFNEFVIDSLALKEYSTLILESKSVPKIFKNYRDESLEKDEMINFLNEKIGEYKKNEIRFDNTLEMSLRENDLLLEKHNIELRKIKWQRNKAYIITVATIIISTLLISR